MVSGSNVCDSKVLEGSQASPTLGFVIDVTIQTIETRKI